MQIEDEVAGTKISFVRFFFRSLPFDLSLPYLIYS
jgi:hypothetical protein